jgi:pimeloyl-ACP methyl ester carboxylesterase
MAATAVGDGQINTATTITHRTVEVGTGVRLHVAEAGPAAAAGAPMVLLLHGFPELWYTWRHQMRALAAAGYRAVAPDLRGYGGSDAPAAPGGDTAGQYTALHVVGDLVALLDALGEERVFVAAHDWGALTAWSLCLFRPDRVRALVALSVAYAPRSAARRPIDGLRALFGDDYYVCRIQVLLLTTIDMSCMHAHQLACPFAPMIDMCFLAHYSCVLHVVRYYSICIVVIQLFHAGN